MQCWEPECGNWPVEGAVSCQGFLMRLSCSSLLIEVTGHQCCVCLCCGRCVWRRYLRVLGTCGWFVALFLENSGLLCAHFMVWIGFCLYFYCRDFSEFWALVTSSEALFVKTNLAKSEIKLSKPWLLSVLCLLLDPVQILNVTQNVNKSFPATGGSKCVCLFVCGCVCVCVRERNSVIAF